MAKVNPEVNMTAVKEAVDEVGDSFDGTEQLMRHHVEEENAVPSQVDQGGQVKNGNANDVQVQASEPDEQPLCKLPPEVVLLFQELSDFPNLARRKSFFKIL